MLKRKSYTRTYTESILGHALVLWRRVLNSSFLLLYFFNPFCSLFLFQSVFLPSPFSFPLSSYYILWLFLPFPPSTCGSGGGSPFFLLLPSFLESSILSCKATCSLFRHHLHINATRGLAGQHLMRRQQYLQIFVFLSLLSFIWYFPFILLQDLSETLP